MPSRLFLKWVWDCFVRNTIRMFWSRDPIITSLATWPKFEILKNASKAYVSYTISYATFSNLSSKKTKLGRVKPIFLIFSHIFSPVHAKWVLHCLIYRFFTLKAMYDHFELIIIAYKYVTHFAPPIYLKILFYYELLLDSQITFLGVISCIIWLNMKYKPCLLSWAYLCWLWVCS